MIIFGLKEKTAPVGYSVNTERHDVSLTYDAEKETVYAETTVSNAPQKATITVLKADKETNIPVENAVYVIKAADTIKVNGKTVYRKGEKVAELTTDKNGKATSEPLYIGTVYRYREISSKALRKGQEQLYG